MPHGIVSLRPMSPDEFDAWRDESVESFAQDLARAMDRPIEAARSRATVQFAELLPDGLESPGAHVLVVLDTQGERIGTLWLGPHPTRGDHGFIYDIVIDDRRRGEGFGRAAMIAAQDVLRADGKAAVGLNVFGSNRTAQRLYESLGFEVVSIQMTKKFAAPPVQPVSVEPPRRVT